MRGPHLSPVEPPIVGHGPARAPNVVDHVENSFHATRVVSVETRPRERNLGFSNTGTNTGRATNAS